MILNNSLFWLIIVPLVSSVLVYIMGRILAPYDDDSPNKSCWICVTCIGLTFIPFYVAAREYFNNGPVSFAISDVTMRFDGISLLISLTVLLLGFVVALFSSYYMQAEEGEEKFYGLLMLMITSIIGLSASTDIFNIYIWFELMALSTYTMVGFYRKQARCQEAGIKYLVQSATGSAFILLGISIIFALTGDVSMDVINHKVSPGNPAFLAAAACLVVGYGIKCAYVPMHKWLPDAHSKAPSGMSAMLSGVVIEAALMAMLRSLGAISACSHVFGYVFLFFGLANIFYGNLTALNQTEVKRMFAYSSIAHMGYITLGVGLALTFPGSSQAANGVFFHIFNHATMKGLAFIAIGVLTFTLRLAKGDHEPLMLDDINGVAQKYPMCAFALSVAVCALASLPPFSGFMSEWEILSAGAQAASPWGSILAMLGALGSTISLGYYAPLINRMYRHKQSETVLAATMKTPVAMSVSMLILIACIVFLGFHPGSFSAISENAAKTFFELF